MKCRINLPKIIDTNVICEAGKTEYETMTPLAAKCAESCYDFIYSFIKNPNSRIVLDIGWEIVREYERNIVTTGQPTLANSFMKWLYSYLAKIPDEDWIDIKPVGDYLYGAFPEDKRLDRFDPPDKKFIAASHVHPNHPHIVEGTDCKWWGYKDILHEIGIDIEFLCEEYITDAFERKIGGTHVL